MSNQLFWSAGTDRARAMTWAVWHLAEVGSRLVVATLAGSSVVVVLERPRVCEDGSQVMLVDDGRRQELRLYRSASAGYWTTRPHERYPGCDQDLTFDGLSAHLCEHQGRPPEQLGLFI